MIKTLVLVPLQDNEGQRFGPKEWNELEQRLIQTFGGFSGGDLIRGAWADNDAIYRDTNRRYEVALASWTKVPDFLNLVAWIRTRFRQIAIYIEIAGIPEIIGE